MKCLSRNAWWRGGLPIAMSLMLSACGGDGSSGNSTTGPVVDSDADFTLAVIPDTQKYARYSPERFLAQTQWIADNYRQEGIAFTVHLGDVVDQADEPSEWTYARQAMQVLEANADTPYSVLPGNHDVMDSSQWDNERSLASEPYLNHFPASLQAGNFTTFQGTDSTGFSSYHIFSAGGREYLVLALDWRSSEQTVTWAQSVLDQHPDLPVILTTHQLLNIAGDGETAIFTDHGAMLWDRLIRSNDQIFLTFNGHHHGEAMMVGKNDYGRDVVMVVVDYQSGFWGGNGMMQLVGFDAANDELDFRSFSPWVAAIPEGQRQPQDELSRWEFSVPMDFDARFSAFNQGAVDDEPGNIDDTQAYWILDEAHRATTTNGNVEFLDASGNGNSLHLASFNDPQGDLSNYFSLTNEPAPFGYADGAASFRGNNRVGGYYLTTEAPGLTFSTSESGNAGYLPTYTIEAIVRLPEDWSSEDNKWSGILNHRPQISRVCDYHQVDCSGGDASLGLNVSSLKEFQWVSTSQNGKGPDNWSWEVMNGYWYHIALINDGEKVQMYVDGSLVMRTGVGEQQGLLVEPGQPWSIGINSWEGEPGNLFAGDIAEIRINRRVLDRSEWLLNR
ncbi:LamG-like jellyroll fold domain-containing protein [Marinobacter xestospongiae]|uniref:LamG-like jellyroll fold domain-containing protein n=1 Tax=Marinobacter xestospongiae TaxID=994319 RepID=UPI0020050D28|nr:LamG-like jellyroll fold domain-containing protein [Marinobacter xestospongiae]MCK7565557.1 metallophosphoesterase [Marinobacter xestospongiae]